MWGDGQKLLDEMDSNVDVAKNRLAQESKRTKQVAKNTGMCKWYSVIILLLISLVYLIIYYFQKWIVCLNRCRRVESLFFSFDTFSGL